MKAPVAITLLMSVSVAASATAQNAKPRPEDTEVWKPVPAVVTPRHTALAPPSDPLILFAGHQDNPPR